MPRPKSPLLAKRAVVAVALRLIDDEGLDALSTRRLAAELNVSGPALYHHFPSMDSIVAGAVELALSEVRVPDADGADWREWLFYSCQLFRAGLLAHPNLFPAISGRGIATVGLGRIERAIEQMGRHGVPPPMTVAIIDAVEAFCIGSALFEYSLRQEGRSVTDIAERYPALTDALQRPTHTPKEQFNIGIRALIDAFAEALADGDVGGQRS